MANWHSFLIQIIQIWKLIWVSGFTKIILILLLNKRELLKPEINKNEHNELNGFKKKEKKSSNNKIYRKPEANAMQIWWLPKNWHFFTIWNKWKTQFFSIKNTSIEQNVQGMSKHKVNYNNVSKNYFILDFRLSYDLTNNFKLGKLVQHLSRYKHSQIYIVYIFWSDPWRYC